MRAVARFDSGKAGILYLELAHGGWNEFLLTDAAVLQSHLAAYALDHVVLLQADLQNLSLGSMCQKGTTGYYRKFISERSLKSFELVRFVAEVSQAGLDAGCRRYLN